MNSHDSRGTTRRRAAKHYSNVTGAQSAPLVDIWVPVCRAADSAPGSQNVESTTPPYSLTACAGRSLRTGLVSEQSETL
jgi:hypothetical protein